MSGWGPRTFPATGGGGVGNPDRDDLPFVEYGEIEVAAGGSANLLNYDVPFDLIHLIRVDFGGENIGDYRLLFNDVVKARFVTWFNGPMDGFWDFSVPRIGGLPLAMNVNIKVRVNNDRDEAGEYFARLQGLRIDV